MEGRANPNCAAGCGDLDYDPSVPSTHGIQLNEKTMELEDFAEPVRLNLWDFGGQEVYHGSHALFLQGQAVFLILWTLELERLTFTEKASDVASPSG